MNTISQFKSWFATHPWLAIFFGFTFVTLPVLVAFKEEWMFPCLLFGILALAGWSLSVWTHGKKILVGLLSLSIFTQPFKAQEVKPAAVPVAVGVVVICVGSYCIYKMVKFCQKKFPASGGTNSVMFLAQGSGDEYGASYAYGAIGSCYDPDFAPASEAPSPVTFTMNVYLGYNNDLTTQVVAKSGEGTYQDFLGFQREAASHGLVVSGIGDGIQHFELNRIPCDPSMVPLRFDSETKEIVHDVGGALRSIIIERSSDLVSWSHFMRTATSEGSGIQVVDTTVDRQMFYRARLQ